jgi:DNA-binding MarR family transcriptional regulator
MTLDDLDPVLSPPKRLAALGMVAAARKVDFSFIRAELDLSDSDLSKQLKALAEAGYITTNKTGRGATRRTWVSITDEGAAALDAHAAALQELIRPGTPPAPNRPADAAMAPPLPPDGEATRPSLRST